MNEGDVHKAGQPIAALGSISGLILSQQKKLNICFGQSPLF